MKFIKLTLLAVVSMFVLAACGGKETTEKYTGDVQGLDTTIEITADGDDVSKEKLTQTGKLDAWGFSSKEQAEEAFKQQEEIDKETYKDIPDGAIETTYTVDDDIATMETTFNYTKDNIKALIDAGLLDSEGNEKADRVSKEKTVKGYEDLGLTKEGE